MIQKTVTLMPVEDPGGRVSVKLGLTKSLGDFDFAKLDVMVTRPCVPTAEGELEAGREAYQSADSMINEFYPLLVPEDQAGGQQ